MNTYIDADAFVRWEKGEFDLLAWLEARPEIEVSFPATVWQQLQFGVFAWDPRRADKRGHFLGTVGTVAAVEDFTRAHAEVAAQLAANLKLEQIGFADFQIAATALVEDAELLNFNLKHLERVPGLKLASAKS